jgi:hypothetical protein
LAIEHCRSQNDLEWIGGALEGVASTLLLGAEEQFYGFDISGLNDDSERIQDRLRNEVIEKCREAISLYARRKVTNPLCMDLQIEAMLKLANFYISSRLFVHANEILMDTHALGTSLPTPERV